MIPVARSCYDSLMLKSDFHYHLPEALIAQKPLDHRTSSRLLVLLKDQAAIDRQFTDLSGFLTPGDLLVLNDTRVIPARLYGSKETGGRFEILVERVIDESLALVHLRASKSPKPGARLLIDGGYACIMIERLDALFVLKFEPPHTVMEVLSDVGHIPLPPYICREDMEADKERYQTVFSKTDGAVAAPTAGLHFDSSMLTRLSASGVDHTFVTLHVGSGTFLPVRVENLDDHPMHAERYTVPTETVQKIEATRSRGGRIVAVGTTVTRALESASDQGTLEARVGETRLFIRPGYDFKVVDAMLTNFHLPESTLLTLVCAFSGYERIMAAYRHAVQQQYRFFSYGDAMFLERNP